MKEYEVTEAQLEKILDACKPVPLIALHLGMPPSQQSMANVAWQALGEEMGFDYLTVKPCGKGNRVFLAEPTGEVRRKEVEMAKRDAVKHVDKDRAKLKAIEKKAAVVKRLKSEWGDAKDASLAAKKNFDTADGELLELITGEGEDTPLLPE